MPKLAEKEHYRPKELAEALDVNIRTVWRWIDEKRVVVLNLGHVLRIPHDEFVRTITQGPRPRK